MTLFTLLVLTLSPQAWAKVTASAQIARASTSVGQPVLLNVIIAGDNSAQVNMPEIDGLSIEPRGHSSNIQFSNGRMTSSITKRYAVIPEKEGEYTIAPITVESKGEKTTVTPTIKIKVTKGIANANPNSPNGAQQPNINLKDLARLEVIGLKDHAVIGELMPVEIRAYFKNSQQAALSNIRSKPSLEGSSFTLKMQEKDPRQGYIKLKGESYFVVIFKAAISPIKPGTFKIPFSMDATMKLAAPSTRARQQRPSGFNDPLFDDFFNRRQLIRKDITLTSDPFAITVTPAPTKEQPNGFDGAIGQFTISASAPTDPIRAGDPITLTVRVSGTGNLSRLKMPNMANNSGWKTYPAKNHLEDENSLGTTGTKVFEQTIVPRNPSVTEIPALHLVYFDPEKESYQTTSTVAIPIKVLPGTNLAKDDSGTGGGSSSHNDPASKALPPKNLVPYSYLGWLRKGRLEQSKGFIASTATTSLAILALAAGVAWTRRRNSSDRQAATAKERNIQSHLREMDSAIGNKDAPAFFQHARQAIQIHAADHLQMQPDAITSTDLTNPDARTIVEMADNINFSGDSADTLDLNEWKQRVVRVVTTSF